MSRVQVALTGGIGSGKSTFAAMLEGYGAARIDADEAARRAVAPGTSVNEKLRSIVPQVFTGDDLDRNALAALIFADSQLKERIEVIIHPWVRADMRTRGQQTLADVVVHEIPLLAEHRTRKELHTDFDYVVTIWSADETRVQRLCQRGMAEADARGRIASQATDASRNAVSDVVVANTSTVERLQTKAQALMALFASPIPGRVIRS